MTAADPTRDRTLPEAEEKAPSAVVPGVPASEPPSLEEPTAPREPAAAQGRPAPAGGGVPDRQADRGAGGLPCPGRGVPDHRAGCCGCPTPTTRSRPGRAARRCCRTTTCARRSPTSTTSASPSAWCTPAAPARTACSSATAPPRRSPRPASSARTSRRRCSSGSRPSLGSRGSADTVRDTRGFATKFYTDEGNFDLVGNNIPVFFIQDGIKFPDVIHAGKPHPDREIPQAQSAHDTFWDFVSLHTEAHAPHDVEHVRPGHPALVPDDGGLRRPHLPAGQRRRARPRW